MLTFTIIDYTTNPLGISTVIDEPIGWDGINLRMKRDKVWHGFFDFADDSVASLQFVGDGFGILKTAYEAYGASANVQLLIEYQCAEGDPYEQLYLGRFVFSTYKDICGDECYSEVSLEALDCLMIFRNRYDQQVDLDSLNTFDKVCTEFDDDVVAEFVAPHTINVLGEFAGTIDGVQIVITDSASNNGTFTVVSYSYDPFYDRSTFVVAESITNEAYNGVHLQGCLLLFTLPAYIGLNKEISLPSKIIFLESKAVSTEQVSVYAIQNPTTPSDPTGYLPNGTGGFLAGSRNGWFTLASNVIQSDLSTMNGSISEYAPNGINADSNPSAVLKLDLLPICPSFQVRVRISFSGTFINTYSANRSEDLKFLIYIGDSAFGGTLIDNTTLYSFTGSVPDTQNFTYSFDQTITLNAGQSIFYYFFYSCFKSDSLQNNPTIRINNDLLIDLSSESECNPTKAGVYLINETLSRCVESTTNDCMRVYSDYFGRTDAEPYVSASDGCGGLRAVLNGLRIRNAPNSDGSTQQKMTVSMQDMFNALNSTDNIGMGLEDDTFRPYENKKLIRVEPQEYFYNNSVLMECDSIRAVVRKVDASLIFSTIKIGYDKWKTWNINGLNDIFTLHQYRTELSELKNELDVTCKFLASDYAIEWTRRQYGLTTADSRYDNDIFFLCLTRQPYEYNPIGQFIAFGGLIVLQGQDYEIAVNDTISITGTTSNNGTFTVLGAANGPFNTTLIDVLEAVIDENTGIPFNIQSTNVALRVEQGLDSPTNILNPDTVYNYRLAPSRNAMRWMKSILRSYRNFITKSIKFTNGEGNILASGEVLTPCRLENAPIAENQDISLDNFADPTANYPLFYPELVTFEYPMTYVQYLTVKANPYGLIGYQCGSSTMEYGWIEDMQYSPYNGLVNFTLRPKIV
jgi:hypothetical protein